MCGLAIFAIWTGLVILAGIWQFYQIQQNTLEFARHDARAAFNKDVSYRHWASNHGGLYAPVTEQTPPNPYLEDLPERDITTPSGRKLTLINPAYMTRQVHELERDFYGFKGHITSLKPIRPENAPDDWERKALQTFTNADDEYSSLEIIDGNEHLRYMRPLLTRQTCLKCHAEQGYKVGDIRGGISVAVPMEAHRAVAARQITNMAAGYILLWAIGSTIILFSGSRIRAQLQKLQDAKQEAENSNYSKSRLLAVISHDIRAPLVSISGLTSVLQEKDIPPEEQQEYIGALKAATKQHNESRR